MLYVSRIYSNYKYGIYDSDDDTFEIVGEEELLEAHDAGMRIKGATFSTLMRMRQFQPRVQAIPYQNPDTMTTAQLKMKVLFGVEVVVFNDAISRITCGFNDRKGPVSVRLSDFGSYLGYRALYYNSNMGGVDLTVIFDDRVGIDKSALYAKNITGELICKYDIREVTDRSLANRVYEQLFETWPFHIMRRHIIDNPERLETMSRVYG